MKNNKFKGVPKEKHYWEVHHKKDLKLLLATAKNRYMLKKYILKISLPCIKYIKSHFIVKHWVCEFYLTKSGRLKNKMKLVEKFDLTQL